MGRKCCVTACRSGYESGDKTAMYRLPKDSEERERWLKAIPRDNIPQGKDTVVCEKHWPANCEKVLVYGKYRPVLPPSVFDCLPKSLVPTCISKKRVTQKATSSKRNFAVDELDEFTKADTISNFDVDLLIKKVNTKSFPSSVISFASDDNIVIQSTNFNSGIPLFSIIWHSNFKFDCYHIGIKCFIPALTQNKIVKLNRWSILEEALNHLSMMEKNHKSNVLNEYRDAMSSASSVGSRIYPPAALIRAFEYFSCSRATYELFRNDHHLPSVRTLTRLTSKVNNMHNFDFLKSVLDNLPNQQKQIILLIDEIYVKPSMSYHGGKIFGKAQNNPNELATTVLAVMVKCVFGGPEFILKMLPVYRLTANFQYDQTMLIIDTLEKCGAQVVAIICDGSQVNRSFFKLFDTIPKKPWLTKEKNIFLLFDYVHLLKCIRNNWLTEKCGVIAYLDENNHQQMARWSDLKSLLQVEESNTLTVKQSMLDYTAVHPKPIERQSVKTCLKVFCDETITALQTHTGLDSIDTVGTVTFIKMFVRFWKIVNVKGPGANLRFNDQDRDVIRSDTDVQLQTLTQLGNSVKSMGSDKKQRVQQLTSATSKAFHHTCLGLVDLAQSLLAAGHKFIILSDFSTDPLEKAFGKLRQGCGGTYFINVQQICEKLSICNAKLALRHSIDVSSLEVPPGHACDMCSYRMMSSELNVFEKLPVLEKDLVSFDEMQAVVYIAGYISRKDEKCDDDTFLYYEKFGSYTQNLSRGKLNIPNDDKCQWCVFCYILFLVTTIQSNVCQKSLSGIFLYVSDFYHFNMKASHCNVLANILLSKLCKAVTPTSHKEPAQKLLKLQ